MQIKKRWIDGLMAETAKMDFKMPFERNANRANIRVRTEDLNEDMPVQAQAA